SQKVQLDVRLDDVVLKTLEKEPQRRYQKASEVKTHVETIASTPSSQPLPSPKSHKWLVPASIAAAAVVILVIGLLAIGVFANYFVMGRPVPEFASMVGAAPTILVTGTVTDTEGKPLNGVRVADIFMNRGADRPVREFWTDVEGRFEFHTWNEGLHDINFSAADYEAESLVYPV